MLVAALITGLHSQHETLQRLFEYSNSKLVNIRIQITTIRLSLSYHVIDKLVVKWYSGRKRIYNQPTSQNYDHYKQAYSEVSLDSHRSLFCFLTGGSVSIPMCIDNDIDIWICTSRLKMSEVYTNVGEITYTFLIQLP